MGTCQIACPAGPGTAADGQRRRRRGWRGLACARGGLIGVREKTNISCETDRTTVRLGEARRVADFAADRQRTLKRRRRKSEAANPKRDLGSYIGEAGITPIRWGASFQLRSAFSSYANIYPSSFLFYPRPAPSRLPRIPPRTRHRLSPSCAQPHHPQTPPKNTCCSLRLPDHPPAHHE